MIRWFEAAWLMHNHCIEGRFHLMDQLYAKLCLFRVGSNHDGAEINDFEVLKQEMLRIYDSTLFSALPGGRPNYSSEQFFTDFAALTVSDNKVSNTILCQISNHIEGEGRELQERREVQVEHILPKTPARGGWWFRDERFSIDEESDNFTKISFRESVT